jgi:nucleoside 2-deoxyribosyltransferase
VKSSRRIEALRDYRLLYLGTPYSKYSAGLDAAFRDASALAGRLLTVGLRVYSPIAHTHPIAIYAGIDPLAHAIWLPFDEAMMDAADACVVAMMDGWNRSVGIAHEIAYFQKAGKPVYLLDPSDLSVDRLAAEATP